MAAVVTDVPRLLRQAIQETESFIDTRGDGLSGQSGVCSLRGANSRRLLAWNADNHQMTWGVLREACLALFDYMLRNNNFGSARFEIYDGNHQVGKGLIE